MPDYKAMYYTLFNVLTDAVEAIETHNFDLAADILRQAQEDAEAQYIEAEE